MITGCPKNNCGNWKHFFDYAPWARGASIGLQCSPKFLSACFLMMNLDNF